LKPPVTSGSTPAVAGEVGADVITLKASSIKMAEAAKLGIIIQKLR
jgi:hypothetical protein